MKYLHIIAAIVSAFLAYPVYLRHGLWWAVVCIVAVVANFAIVVLEDKHGR